MRFPKFGIRSRIILNLIVLMAATVGLITLATLRITTSSIIKQKLISGNILVRSIQSSIDSIFQGDPESFQKDSDGIRLSRLIRSFGRESGFNSLFIVDREGRILAHSGDEMKGTVVYDEDMDKVISKGETITRFERRERWPYWRVGNELKIHAPLYIGSEIVGGIRAHLPLSDVQKIVTHTQKSIFLYMIFDAIIIIILGSFLLSRGIVKPIKKLLGVTQRLGEGDFSQRIEEGGIDELGALSLSLNRMSRRLEEYVQSLETANRELKQAHNEIIRSEKLASVGRLAAGVAHEIGNPIGAILGYAHILKAGESSKEEEKDYLNRIEKESSRIDTIIRNLLDFSRPSKTEVKDVDINTIINSAVSLLSPQKTLQSISINLQLEESLPKVFVDETLFQQVMINLIINAGHAMPQGGELTIQTKHTSIETMNKAGQAQSQWGHSDTDTFPLRRRSDPPDLDYVHLRKEGTPLSMGQSRHENWVMVKVSDTGCGIKEEDKHRIFDPFFTTRPPGQGTGLGLSTSLRIVESFHGHIHVESQEGKGATFVILLPFQHTMRSKEIEI